MTARRLPDRRPELLAYAAGLIRDGLPEFIRFTGPEGAALDVPVLPDVPEGEGFRFTTPAAPGVIFDAVAVDRVAHGARYILTDGRIIRGDNLAAPGKLRVDWQDGTGWHEADAATVNPLVLGRIVDEGPDLEANETT